MHFLGPLFLGHTSMGESVIREFSKIWKLLETELFEIESTTTLFNPYRDEDHRYDRDGAAEIRKNNLRNYFESFKRVPKILMVGEAPGFGGCRFSGVPFTSEEQLFSKDFPLSGKQSSKCEEPQSEKTADYFWETIEELPLQSEDFFMWNSVPLHPPSNRTPRVKETEYFSCLLLDIATLLDISLFISVGRVAEDTFKRIGIESCYVRHPSHGGQRKFREDMRKLFDSFETRAGRASPQGKWVGCNPPVLVDKTAVH